MRIRELYWPSICWRGRRRGLMGTSSNFGDMFDRSEPTCPVAIRATTPRPTVCAAPAASGGRGSTLPGRLRYFGGAGAPGGRSSLRPPQVRLGPRSRRGDPTAPVDVVVLAGDLLDIASGVPIDVQITVVLGYLERFAAVGHTLVCSGNHDLDHRTESGEKATGWLVAARHFGVHVDGDSFDLDGWRLTACAWWEGPLTLAELEVRLASAATDRPPRWLWAFHGPPEGPLSWTGARHYGDPELPRLLAQHRPDVVLCGHVHQAPFTSAGSWVEHRDATWLFNAGVSARASARVHRPRPRPPPSIVVVDRRARRGRSRRSRNGGTRPPASGVGRPVRARLDVDRRLTGDTDEYLAEHRPVVLVVGELSLDIGHVRREAVQPTGELPRHLEPELGMRCEQTTGVVDLADDRAHGSGDCGAASFAPATRRLRRQSNPARSGG